AGAGGAHRSSLDEFAGNLADALFHPRLAALPGLPAQAVKRRMVAGAAVARQDIDILDRDIEFVAAGIFQRDAVVRRLADLDRRQAFVAGNAVVGMDDEVPGREGREFGKEGGSALAALLAAA